MHESYEMEGQIFLGFITPLVIRLEALIEEKKGREPFIGLHLGGGGREVDRQVLRNLMLKNIPARSF